MAREKTYRFHDDRPGMEDASVSLCIAEGVALYQNGHEVMLSRWQATQIARLITKAAVDNRWCHPPPTESGFYWAKLSPADKWHVFIVSIDEDTGKGLATLQGGTEYLYDLDVLIWHKHSRIMTPDDIARVEDMEDGYA